MKHIGRESTLLVDGKEYRLSRFTRRLARLFLEWADSVLPNSLQLVWEWLDDFPPSLHGYMVREALAAAKCRLSFNNPDVQILMTSPRGMGEIVSLLLRLHHPELSHYQAYEVYEAARRSYGDERMEAVIVEASGEMPREDDQVELDAMRELGLLPKPAPPVVTPYPEPEDWLKIDAALMQHYALKPWEIEELTLTEILVYFANAEKEGQTFDQALDHAQLYNRLTAREKLLIGMRQYG